MSAAQTVQLYVYDLSNGLARALSMPLLGKQIDGIWHTSVVIYGREIYFGQGILESRPGMTHHGAPLHRLDMGSTEIPEETFDEYLDDLRSLYTADKYHLLRFNCNSFTADVVGFLTGGTIPTWISNLPEDVMSTPFGASLRPQIEAMFSRPSTNPQTSPAPNLPQSSAGTAGGSDLRNSLLNAIAAQAAGASQPTPPASRQSSTPTPPSAERVVARETASAVSPLIVSTNAASFETALASHNFTVATFLPPSIQVDMSKTERFLEELAKEESPKRSLGDLAFVMVRSQAVANKFGVTTDDSEPVFVCFDGREKLDDLIGLSEEDLRAVISLHIEESLG